MVLTVILIFLLVLTLIIIFISYKQSDRILYRKFDKKPLVFSPEQFDIPYKDVSFKNDEGLELKGWFIPAKVQSDKTIIFLHGWGLNKGDLFANTSFLREQNFNLFYFDFRSSGTSQAGRSSIGYFETKDAQNALDYICKTYPEETKNIGIYGLSMGAAVAIYTAAHNKSIKCVVSESCYFSYEKVVARWARLHKHVPYFPLVALILFFVRKRLGVNPEDFCPKNNIKKLAPRPILIIGGKSDKLTPKHDARNLFLTARHPKQLWLIEGAQHTDCAQKAAPLYQERLAEFFNTNLGK